MLDETGQLGFGTVPDEVLHLKDDDSGVSAKIGASSGYHPFICTRQYRIPNQ